MKRKDSPLMTFPAAARLSLLSFMGLPLLLMILLTSMTLTGCAGAQSMLGIKKLEVPAVYKQKILLRVNDKYKLHQATRSVYDPGDLQSFHSQHTFPIVATDAFKEIFGEVEVLGDGPRIDMGAPDVPAIFEVQIKDLAHDIYNEADSYRSVVLLEVVMKSPREEVFWRKVVRGEGYVLVDTQFDIGTSGPQNAVLDGMSDAIYKMQDAIVESPQVRLQMEYYAKINAAREQSDKS